MRILLGAIASVIVAAPVMATPISPLQRETAVWQAVQGKHMDAFAASMSPDFVGVYSEGTHYRPRELEIVRRQRLRSFAIHNFRSRMVGPDSMLMTYSADVQGTYKGASFSGRYWNTSLWHRSGGRWLTVYHGEAKER
jgi:hypothetical protein